MSATTVADIRVAERSRRRATRGGRWLRNGGWYLVLTALALVTVFPFAWMVLTSIKGPADPITSVPPQFLPNDPTLAAYGRVWDSLPIPSYFLNSTIVAVATGLLNVLVAAMAAYPLAKMRFAGRDFVFYMLLATLIVPAQLTYIPSFILAVNVFHYYNTLAALIFPSIVSAFNIFLLRQAFLRVPNEYWEAAQLDGSTGLGFLWRIMLPLTVPALFTVALFGFLSRWNALLWPLIVTRSESMRPVQVAMIYYQNEFQTNYGMVMAASFMVTLPIIVVFVLAQKNFIAGISSAGLKG